MSFSSNVASWFGKRFESTSNAMTRDSDVWAAVCDDAELGENEIKEFPLEGNKILLARLTDGTVSALSTKCTHYGAPLSKGSFSNDRVRCPWHGACFSAVTGDIEDMPGLDSLTKYIVKVEHGKVLVSFNKDALVKNYREKVMATLEPANSNIILILGGGAAAQTCAEAARQEGYTGRLIIATKDLYQPYDRVKLSKMLDAEFDKLKLRTEEFMSKNGIEVLTNKEASGVDVVDHSVTFTDQSTIVYNSLIIATGANPQGCSVPGCDLSGIHTLRSLSDANAIAKAVPGKKVVIIGTSFIGMEVAAYCVGKASSVVVVGRGTVPFQLSLGSAVGQRLKTFHEEKGVKFAMNTTVSEFRGANGVVSSIILENGTEIDCDVCVLGLGVTPSTGFLEGSPIDMNRQGYICVDENLRTSVKDVYAAGDVTEFPLFLNKQRVSIGHWQLASTQGKVAGMNAVGKDKVLKSVPFFWTMQYGKGIRYAGYGKFDDDKTFIDGSVDDMKCVVYYANAEGQVVSIATMNSDPVAAQFADFLLAGKKLHIDDVRVSPSDWTSQVQSSCVLAK